MVLSAGGMEEACSEEPPVLGRDRQFESLFLRHLITYYLIKTITLLSDTISNPQLHPQQFRRCRWISIEYPGRSRVRMRGQCPKASPLIPAPIAVTTVISTKRTPPRGAGFIFLFRSRTRSPRRSVRAISDGIMTGTGLERRMRGNPTRTCQPRRHCHDRTDAGHHHQGR